jgi:divalent metal cation (Fe/Co/Zn/Cd) transporter
MDKSLKIALGSLGVSLVVPAVKFTAYLNTGSLAPYSDALESIINVATSIAAIIAIRIAARPADAGHPYSYHKAEYVGGRHRRARQSAAMPPMLSKTHALRTRHAGKSTFVDFDLVVSGI